MEPVREQAEAEPVETAGADDIVAATDVDELDEDEPDLEDEADEDEAGEDETLEEQEEDIEEAQAELEEERKEPVTGGRRTRPAAAAAAAVAERPRPAPRSTGRNRRRGATPQPQGPAVVRFFRETFDELRKVDWPSPSELYRYTIIVIITVIVLAAFISGIDWVLQQLAQRFIYGASTG